MRRALHRWLLEPWPPLRSAIAVGVASVTLFVIVNASSRMHDPRWGVDEGQRIAESYFWRLLLDGQVRHPDWFRVITDSSHPQMSKYWFGLAAQVQGAEVPRDLALPRYYESGGLAATGWQPPPHLLPRYEPLLLPSRRAALFCNVLSFATVLWLALRGHGAAAGVIAVFLFLRHYLPVTLAVAARSDALQTAALTSTLLPVAALWSGSWKTRRGFAHAVVIGVLAAIAFQTRLNGLLALGASGVVLLLLGARVRRLRPLLLAAVAGAVCLLVSVLSNPYYWSRPEAAAGVAREYLTDEPLPLRVVTRFRLQVRDLGILLDDHAYAALPAVPERARFVSRVLFSGIAGKVLLAGALLSVVLLSVRRGRRVILLPLLWTAAVVIPFTLWIPLHWEPYVLMIFPSMVLLAAAGWTTLARALLPENPEPRTENPQDGHTLATLTD